MVSLHRENFDKYVDKYDRPLITDEAWYDIVSYITEVNDDSLQQERLNGFHDHLSSALWDSWITALYNHPEFNQQKTDRLLEYEIYLSKTSPPEDKIPCPFCGSTNVIVHTSQKRALDEAGSAEGVCKNCGKKFHAD